MVVIRDMELPESCADLVSPKRYSGAQRFKIYL